MDDPLLGAQRPLWRRACGVFWPWLLLFSSLLLLAAFADLGDALRGAGVGTVLLSPGQCPMSTDTGRSCHIFECGDRSGISACAASAHCICKPGYCAERGFCQLNASGLQASVFPVNSEQPVFPRAHSEVRTALCVSGGGARSMSSTLGALRSLHHLGLMDRVDAISSVSGGSWASALYMFANQSVDQVIGDYRKSWRPEKLTMDFLESQPSLIGEAASSSMKDFLSQDSSVHSKMQTLWARYVGRMVLAPAGLDRTDAFMAGSEEEVRRIKRNNPMLSRQPFLVPQPRRPKVFVMNGALLAPMRYEAESSNVVSFQMSPDYTGSPHYPNNAPVHYSWDFFGWRLGDYKAWVGGGFVETFAFGGSSPDEPDQAGGGVVSLPAPRVPFSLQSALAISSAAFGKLLADLPDIGVKVDPEELVWPITPNHQDAVTYSLGDGGNIENAGVLAMLQRRARQIIWLVNTDVGISATEPFCELQSTDNWDPFGKVTDQVTDKFGFGRNSAITWLGKNQVFRREDLPPLLCRAQNLIKSGRPAVLRQQHEVLPNSWWGIEGGFTVDVLYVFNQGCENFREALPASTRQELDLGEEGPFAHFPFYKTTLQNEPEFTALTRSQVVLLAALAEYSLLENADVLRDFLAA